MLSTGTVSVKEEATKSRTETRIKQVIHTVQRAKSHIESKVNQVKQQSPESTTSHTQSRESTYLHTT